MYIYVLHRTKQNFSRIEQSKSDSNVSLSVITIVLFQYYIYNYIFLYNPLKGESVDDCGGGYSESIAEMCDELESRLVPVLTLTPNGRDEAGANRDCFLLMPPPDNESWMNTLYKMFQYLGKMEQWYTSTMP